MVCNFKDQQRSELEYKMTAVEPVISDKDWPQKFENIWDYLATILGFTGSPLAYIVRTDMEVHDEAEDPDDNYLMGGARDYPLFSTLWTFINNHCLGYHVQNLRKA
jgi:hypothetical protein